MSRKLTLVVDNRETRVIDKIKQLDTSFEFLIDTLEVGDFLFRDENNVPVALFERKTPSDLNSSILSHRHHQQRQRLATFQMTYPSCYCGYIIEGLSKCLRDSVADTRVQGAIENLLFKHGFIVLPTSCVLTTAKCLISLNSKLVDLSKPLSGGSSAIPVEHEAQLHHSKMSRTAENIFYHQLCVVPHVGQKLAKVIAEEWISASQFSSFLESENSLDVLSNKKVGKRRIGMSTATKIRDAFKNGKL